MEVVTTIIICLVALAIGKRTHDTVIEAETGSGCGWVSLLGMLVMVLLAVAVVAAVLPMVGR